MYVRDKHSNWRMLGASVAIAVAIAVSSASTVAAQDKFKIGAICSLTGPAAGFGKPYCDGLAAYVKAWNARGGYKGEKIELTMLDDETSAVTGVAAFRRLGDDKDIRIIWLGISSNTVLAIKPLASEVKIPIITGGAVDTIGVPANPYVFKVAPGTEDFTVALLKWSKDNGVKSIATINATDAYGQSEAKYFRELGPKYGIKIVAQETFAVTDTNFTTQLVSIRSAKPDLVYSGAVGRPSILIFQQYKQLKLPFRLALSQGALFGAFFEAIGGPKEAEGILTVTNQGTLGKQIGGEPAVMYEKLEAALGHPAMIFNTLAWDHGTLTEWAAMHSDGSREGIRAALDTVKELPAINGPFNFRPDNHIGQDDRGLKVVVFKGGKFVIADGMAMKK